MNQTLAVIAAIDKDKFMRSEMKMVMFSTAVVGMVAAATVIPAQADTALFLGGAHARYRIVQPLQRITNADLPNMGATYYDSMGPLPVWTGRSRSRGLRRSGCKDGG